MAVPRNLVGNYVIERELGRGGMGIVYSATHRVLGRRAAIKVLSDPAQNVERFFNEARAAMAIEHPGVVRIYDVGRESDGHAYIAMELLDGESLAERLTRGPLPVRVAVAYARQITEALAAVHALQIVHRDLKPENVIVVGNERLKLVDFGVAKLGGPLAGMVKTISGALVGTPLYMSPEQCDGAGEVDARSDLYSVGCMIFVMITGQPPFVSNGMGAVIGMHMYEAPPLLRSRCPAAPPALERVVARLLAKDPGDRFPTARELAAALADPAILELSDSAEAAATAPAMPRVEVPQVPTATTAPPAQLERRRWSRVLIPAAIAGALLAIAALVIGTRSNDAVEEPVKLVMLPVDAAAAVQLPDAFVPVEPATVTLTIEGAPPGTELRVRGTLYGVAPRVELPRGTQEVLAVLTSDGYQALSVPLTPDRDQRLPVRLKARPKPVRIDSGEPTRDMLEFPE